MALPQITEEKHNQGVGDNEPKDHPQDSVVERKAECEAKDEEDNTQYPPRKKVIPAIVAGYLVVFLVALDRTIIGTAVPSISNEFQSFGDIAWYEAAFLLPLCVFGLSIGRLLTFYSTKWIIVIEILIFEIGNLVCATARSSSLVIAGRAITGIGGAGIVAAFLVLINTLVPLSKRPKYTGGLGACFGLSSILGPLLGGYLTSITWRWVFWINLPIGGAALILFVIAAPNTKPPDAVAIGWWAKIKQLDPIGFLCLAPATICIIFALQWGGTKYAWNDGRIIALFVLSGILGIAFICSQIFLSGGTVSAAIIKQRSVLAGVAQSIAIGSLLVICSFYIPIYFQAIKNDTPQGSGLALLPLFLSTVVFVISTGIGISKIGYYTPFAILGGVLLIVGAALISTWQVDTPMGIWIGYQIIAGAGQGLSLQQANVAVQTVLPQEKAPAGLALLQFVQFLAGSILITVCQTVLQVKLADGLSRLGIGIDGEAIAQAGATSLRSLVSVDQLPKVLVIYNDALRNIWYIAVALCVLNFLASLCYEWKNVKHEEEKRKILKKDAPEQANV